jgi:hypothetical protein
MRPFLAFVALAFLPVRVSAALDAGTAVGARVPRFQAKVVDLSGTEAKTRDFDSHVQPKVTAYVFVGTTCPATGAYVDRMRELERTYRPNGVEFVYVYPNRTDSSDAKTEFHKTARLAGSMIDDQGGKVARALAAQRTSEVVLVGKDGRILYRGAIDDSREPGRVSARYVATALDEHLTGKPVAKTTTDVQA